MLNSTVIYALDTEGNILGSGVIDTKGYPDGTLFVEATPSMGYMKPKWNFETQLWEEGSKEAYPINPPAGSHEETHDDTNKQPDLSEYVSKEEFKELQQLSLKLYQQIAQIRSDTVNDSKK